MHICRPPGLRLREIAAVVAPAVGRLGPRCDLKNIVDLVRDPLPTPPVPTRRRRRMLAFGSGDTPRAICSTTIARAVRAVRCPILPRIESLPAPTPGCAGSRQEVLRVAHHSLFVPRGVGRSAYVEVVKAGLDTQFDPHAPCRAAVGADRLAASGAGVAVLPAPGQDDRRRP